MKWASTSRPGSQPRTALGCRPLRSEPPLAVPRPMPLAPPDPQPSSPCPALALARQGFLAAGHTIENVLRDFPEWHRGRPDYLLWAIDADLPAVRSQVAQAARQLDGLLLEHYVRQPHITLALCGFPADTPQWDDDFDAPRLQIQLNALQHLADAPITLQIGQPASFSSAPFLTVHEPDGILERLHNGLAYDRHRAGNPPYLPHLTVGLYRGRWPTASIQARLDACCVRPHTCTFSRISLMSYASTEIGGRLTRIADYDLATGALHWGAGALPERLQDQLSRCRLPADGISSHPSVRAVE